MSKMLKTVRSNLNRFTGMAVSHLATLHNLGDDQVKALRNLIREGTRNGGKTVEGYYATLPSGKGSEVQVSPEQEDAAYNTARTALNKLVIALAGAGEIEGTFTHEGATKTALIPTEGFEAFEDSDLDAWIEASAMGGSGNAAIASLDF